MDIYDSGWIRILSQGLSRVHSYLIHGLASLCRDLAARRLGAGLHCDQPGRMESSGEVVSRFLDTASGTPCRDPLNLPPLLAPGDSRTAWAGGRSHLSINS